MAPHGQVEGGLVPILADFLFNCPLVVAETADPVGLLRGPPPGWGDLLAVLADCIHKVAEGSPPVVGDEPAHCGRPSELRVGELEGMSELQDDVVAHVVHSSVGAVVPVEEVIKLLQLSCRDGPRRPSAAAGWVGILALQPLDEVQDVLLEPRSREVAVPEAVQQDGDEAADGHVKAASARHELLVAAVQIRHQTCVASNRQQGPNDEGQAQHPHA
mmetsp:Transcript_37222/g.88896  ORF Transcript_37222/g.88896 Transcript_37222/m.88896 type:complete len:216 (+) Transcript_37222:1052-1699(+)